MVCRNGHAHLVAKLAGRAIGDDGVKFAVVKAQAHAGEGGGNLIGQAAQYPIQARHPGCFVSTTTLVNKR